MNRQPKRKPRPKSKSASKDLFEFDKNFRQKGFVRFAGIDEAGRGCLAGPVVAAAVVLPEDCMISGLNDSKKLTPKKREILFDEISGCALAFAVGIVDWAEIDEINIFNATHKAMRIAVDGLKIEPGHLLIDGKFGIKHRVPETTVISGDSTSAAIAAASIIAKVSRDRMMCEFEKKYPKFKFSEHKGYGTEAHLAEIRRHGPTPIHRMTFQGVK